MGLNEAQYIEEIRQLEKELEGAMDDLKHYTEQAHKFKTAKYYNMAVKQERKYEVLKNKYASITLW